MLFRVASSVVAAFLIALAPAVGQTSSPPPTDFSIADGAVATSVRLDSDALAANELIAAVSINGQGPFPFVLDTGGRNVVDSELAQKLGLVLAQDDTRYWGTGGWSNFQDTSINQLTIGRAVLRDQTALAYPINSISADIEFPFRGIIGAELLERFVVVVDYARETVPLGIGAFTPTADAVALPIDFPVYENVRGRTPMVAARINGIEGWFLIDTGDSGSLTLLRTFVAAHGLEGHFRNRVTERAAGFGGMTEETVSRAQSFTLGPMTFLEPIVSIPEGETGPSPPGDTQ